MELTSIGGFSGKTSPEILVLALLEERERHGYEIGRLIADRSRGVFELHIASIYPLLYRLERRGWIAGRWVEKPNQRRRRFYRLLPEGQRALAGQRRTWREFVTAVNRVMRPGHA